MIARRTFLTRCLTLASALPLVRAVQAQPTDLPHLSPEDPAAKALAYTENAGGIDAKAEAVFRAGSRCANCNFFQAAQANGNYAPCTIFPGKSVNQGGWCRAWAPKAA